MDESGLDLSEHQRSAKIAQASKRLMAKYLIMNKCVCLFMIWIHCSVGIISIAASGAASEVTSESAMCRIVFSVSHYLYGYIHLFIVGIYTYLWTHFKITGLGSFRDPDWIAFVFGSLLVYTILLKMMGDLNCTFWGISISQLVMQGLQFTIEGLFLKIFYSWITLKLLVARTAFDQNFEFTKAETIRLFKEDNRNKNKNKEDNALTDSNQLVSAIGQRAWDIFEKDVKTGQNRYEMLWKYAKDTPKEKFILELLTSPQEIISSLGKITDSAFHTSMLMYIEHLFAEVTSKAVEIKETIYNFFADFNDFLAMMLRCLEFLTPNSPEYGRYVDMMVAFGSTFNQDSSGSQILFLENFGLTQVLSFAQRISNKKDALVKILLSVCGQDEGRRLRLLRRIEKLLGGDYNTLSGLLAHMSIDQAELGFSGEIYEFYWTKAITIINGTCNPKIKAAALKILNELSIDNYRNMPEVYPTLRKLCTETWWEVKSQILIICANQLNLIEMAAREDEIKSQKDRSGLQNTQEHGEETVEAAIPKIEAEAGGANVGFGTLAAGHISKGSVVGNDHNSQMEQTDKHLRTSIPI